ncbi:hypothetical protein VC83_08228 [Pseudogymnoascus destructans]|uniref:tRNA (adenine(58)-N(1))-methyltransferase catalytic subunit TRM61 n=1 Tax=Pseudogymnoascus destructans TaxID=655981 RepID=A0A176ZZ94_9PEZI|nr:uncharacterized protein VC83_08228 [Pseudogymnoascus destructans]OAF55339.1 hypothetical protein VC83_08228 [Pseudogymnoascus destructans]
MPIAFIRCGSTIHRIVARSAYSPCAALSYSSYVFQENDIVLVQKKTDPSAKQILSKPLRPGKIVNTSTGHIDHESIIGLSPRAIVSTATGKGEYRVYRPTLGEYTNLTARIVTPVYPADANLIISLLDLNPTVPDPSSPSPSPPLEIFEAGTGHGALTLHLARAIHAANPAPPPIPSRARPVPAPDSEESTSDAVDAEHQAAVEKWEAYKPTRRAVVTTFDVSARHSAHAQTVVAGWRKGMYEHSVDFHVGSISEYISSRLATSLEPFLDHTILDLPDCHLYLETISRALKEDGTVLVFCPSITQIIACVKQAKKEGLPLVLETTLEIGQAAGVGGRVWDVRAVRARSFVRAEAAEAEKVESAEGVESGTEGSGAEAVAETTPKEAEHLKPEGDGWNMVCRPKVGDRVVGGGFVGVFRRVVK